MSTPCSECETVLHAAIGGHLACLQAMYDGLTPTLSNRDLIAMAEDVDDEACFAFVMNQYGLAELQPIINTMFQTAVRCFNTGAVWYLYKHGKVHLTDASLAFVVRKCLQRGSDTGLNLLQMLRDEGFDLRMWLYYHKEILYDVIDFLCEHDQARSLRWLLDIHSLVLGQWLFEHVLGQTVRYESLHCFECVLVKVNVVHETYLSHCVMKTSLTHFLRSLLKLRPELLLQPSPRYASVMLSRNHLTGLELLREHWGGLVWTSDAIFDYMRVSNANLEMLEYALQNGCKYNAVQLRDALGSYDITRFLHAALKNMNYDELFDRPLLRNLVCDMGARPFNSFIDSVVQQWKNKLKMIEDVLADSHLGKRLPDAVLKHCIMTFL